MKRFKKLVCVIVALVTLSSMIAANACTCIAVGKDASDTGATIIGHTCDGWYDNRVKVITGGTHAEGEMIDIYRDPCQATMTDPEIVGQIPQVAETYTFFNVGYPFMNEKGVTISEHTWSGDYSSFYNGEQALFVIANLEMLGLQRGATAREVVQIMGALAEKYGYADGGECLIVSDGTEIWIFEISGPGAMWTPDSGTPGAHWAARRVPSDEVWAGANRSTLGVIDFNDPENYMWSTDITKYPIQLGLYTEGDPFNYSWIFDTAYRSQNTAYSCSTRVWRIFDLVAPSLKLPNVNGYQAIAGDFPFSVKPDQKVSLQYIDEVIYRDHYEGTPYDTTVGFAAGPFGNPIRNSFSGKQRPETEYAFLGWPRVIAINRCSYSFIAENRAWMPLEIGTVLWYGADDPTTTCRIPIYAGTTDLPTAWSETDRWTFDQDSAFWAFQFVNNYAQLWWENIYADITAKRAEIQGKFYAEQAEVDAKALELYNSEGVDAAKAYLTEYVCASADYTYDQWWDFAWYLVGKYTDGTSRENGKSSTIGYPMEWLEAAGLGECFAADHEAYLKEMGLATEEPAEEPEAPAEEPKEEPKDEAPAQDPAPAPVETESSNSTGLIIGVIAVVVVAVAAYFVMKKKN